MKNEFLTQGRKGAKMQREMNKMKAKTNANNELPSLSLEAYGFRIFKKIN